MGWKGWESFVPPDGRSVEVPVMTRKYLNRKTVAMDGTPCDSKAEAARWDMLVLLQKGGFIADLLPHPSFPLFVNGRRTGRITFDSGYIEKGRLVLEDVKSPRTKTLAAYRQRVTTFTACYPHVTVREWLA